MFPIIRRDVAMVLTQTGAVFFLMSSFIAISMTQYMCASFWRLVNYYTLRDKLSRLRTYVLINGPLWEEFIRHEWIPHTKGHTDHWLFMFTVRSFVELSRPVVVHCRGHLPICSIWACSWAKTCQICHKLGPDFADRIPLKPLDGFTPLKVSWTSQDL